MEATHTKESGHWYRKDGTPAYTVIGKNGQERNTTLRDARKEGLLPSVTSIIRCAAAPGLELWKSQQVLMAALTTDRLENEPEQAWIDRIIKDANEQSLKARERGTLIHAYVQDGFEGNLQQEGKIYYESARATVDAECGDLPWLCETSFSTERYGGKIDLHNNGHILDLKTTEKDLETIKTWDEHHMQLAAYDRQYGNKCGILYINVNTAASKLIWIDADDIEKGWQCFNALLDFYYAKTRLGREV